MVVLKNGNVGIGADPGAYKLNVTGGNAYFSGNVSALSITDRTPYPKDLETAYKAVLSMSRLPDGEYDENNKENQLDHSTLHPFVKSSDGEHRDLSATVSAQNEVIKDLVKQIGKLKDENDLLNEKLNEILELLEKD
jgi:septal ring factor EnvC (AmiA/AmiB activator)